MQLYLIVSRSRSCFLVFRTCILFASACILLASAYFVSAGTAFAMIVSLLSSLSLGAAFWCRQVTAALDRSSLVAQLKSPSLGLSPGTQIFFPSDPLWETETTQRWTVHDAPTYVASIKPALESDVQKIV